MSQVPSDLVSPSGQSIIGSLLSGEKDPTAITEPPSGGIGGNLQSHDMDCASDSLLGFITEPFCVAGKSLTKGAGGIGAFLSSPLFIVGIVVIVVLIIVALYKK